MDRRLDLLSLCFFSLLPLPAKPQPYATPGPEDVQKFELASVPAKENRSRAASHKEAFQMLDEKVRDPFIIRGPDGFYYLTGTTAGSHWGDTVGIRLWKSSDLIEWRDLGFVWELNKDGRKQSSWHFDRPAKDGVKNGHREREPLDAVARANQRHRNRRRLED